MEAEQNNRGGDSLQQRLQPILELLERHELVEHIAAHDASPNQTLVNQMLVRQQQVELQRKLAQLDPAEVAHLLGILPQGKCYSVWAQVPLELAGEVLSEAESGLCGNLVGHTEPERLVRILVELDVDELSRLDQINRGNLWQIAGREVLISVLNGLLWGGVLGCFALLLYGSPPLGLVLQMATTLNLVIAAIAGVAVPMLLKELGRDPAVGSSVVLTFLTDSMGFLLFLGLASVLLVR